MSLPSTHPCRTCHWTPETKVGVFQIPCPQSPQAKYSTGKIWHQIRNVGDDRDVFYGHFISNMSMTLNRPEVLLSVDMQDSL